MNFFPAMIPFDNRKILMIGAGEIATSKTIHLLNFTKNITIIAPDISLNMQSVIVKNKLKLEKKRYTMGDIKGYDIIINAVDSIDLQKTIYDESRDYRSLYNAVDELKYCDFIFPSYIKKGDLIISISTSGTSPTMSKQLKEYFDNKIPDSIKSFLNEMKELRNIYPKGRIRREYFKEKVHKYIKENL